MIRSIAGFLLLTCGLALGAQGAEEGQLDSSRSLFAVLAAINAAGYDADLQSPANSSVREMVRREIAAKHPESLAALKLFFAEHRQKDETAELSQYVSLALCLGDPPDFPFRYKESELPPDVLPLQDFQAILRKFAAEAGLDDLWRKAQPAYEAAIARYHAPASGALLEVNAYVRNSGSGGVLGTRFQIYVDLLGAPNQIQMRSYKSDYFIVVTPSPEPQRNDIRHGYLHHLLDPLSIRWIQELTRKEALLEYAQPAPLLEPYYKRDFPLLADECLIKAVEARLAPASARQAIVDQAMREGYILTAGFADLLSGYEKQQQALRFYYQEMVSEIDMGREEKRLRKVEFATERPVRKAKIVPAESIVEPQGAGKTLAEAENYYRERDLEKAKSAYSRLLRETADATLHAKAYYGLARIAALDHDPELSESMFQKALDSSPDDEIKAWCYVYLGRLADAAGEREQAKRQYQAALAVSGASEGARKAATSGLDRAFERSSQQP
ncbi:MAG: tetratricopeptide repeat protein [Bryobacteraceae bacterium]